MLQVSQQVLNRNFAEKTSKKVTKGQKIREVCLHSIGKQCRFPSIWWIFVNFSKKNIIPILQGLIFWYFHDNLLWNQVSYHASKINYGIAIRNTGKCSNGLICIAMSKNRTTLMYIVAAAGCYCHFIGRIY